MSDLDDIISGNEPEQDLSAAPVEAPEVAQEEPVAEAGASPTEEPEAASTEPEQPAPENQTVPLATFIDTRAELREAQRQLQQMAMAQQAKRPEPQPLPDVIEDQAGFVGSLQRQVGSAMTAARMETKMEMSRFLAEREFGKEAVQQAVDYFNDHPGSERFLNEASPFHAAVEFVKQQQVAAEIGNDPAAYEAKVEARVRAKIEAEMAAKQAADMAGKTAPSVANINGAGGRSDPGWAGPAPLSDLIGE